MGGKLGKQHTYVVSGACGADTKHVVEPSKGDTKKHVVEPKRRESLHDSIGSGAQLEDLPNEQLTDMEVAALFSIGFYKE